MKVTTGRSAHDILNQMLLLEAKALLISTGLSISEIAFKLNHSDPSSFTRFFKSNTGKSPKEYRQEKSTEI